MRVVVASLGSMGDVQPFVALADELRRYGHQSVFALPAHLLPYARRRGFAGIQIGPDELSDVYQRATRAFEYGEASEEGERYYEALLAAAPQAFQDITALCAEADLLISSVIMPLGRMIHEVTGIPFISIQTYNPAEEIDMPAELNTFRAHLGLPPIQDPKMHGVSPRMLLVAISRELLPANINWPPHSHITGFFFPDEQDWQPDPALATFVRAGPRPIVVTLGSIMHRDPAQLTQLFLRAIEAVGCRAIIQHGWTGLAKDIHLPETIHVVDYVPHGWLFSQATCAVHHGGGGTTHAALRAGIPTVVIPSDPGVLPWAQSAYRLGCAGAVIPYQELSAEQLSTALIDTLAASQYRTAALEIGARIEAEHGTQTARMLIERFMTPNL